MAGLVGVLLIGCASEGGAGPDSSVGAAGGSGTAEASGAGQAGTGEAGRAEPGASCAEVDWKEGLDASVALDDTCGACGSGEGIVCFSVGDDFKVCGAADPPEATECVGGTGPAQKADECGCNGLVCADGKRCVTVHETASGGHIDANRCLALCQDNQDCAAGEACLPDRLYLVGGVGVAQCVTPECTEDADCSEDGCGHCVHDRAYTFQGNQLDFPSCVYAGSLASAGCADAQEFGTHAHVCHPFSLPMSYRTNPN
jgi:hypothetical protein